MIPDPSLVKDVGVVGWLLMVIVLSGVGTVGWFLKRMAESMDRMARAQEAAPSILGEIRALLGARFDHVDSELRKAVTLAEEHVAIGRLWKQTEAPHRRVRGEDEDKNKRAT